MRYIVYLNIEGNKKKISKGASEMNNPKPRILSTEDALLKRNQLLEDGEFFHFLLCLLGGQVIYPRCLG